MTMYYTFDRVLGHWATQSPDAPALAAPRQRDLSYRELYDIVSESRGFLARNGLGRNDRIALVHSGGAEMAAAALSIGSSATIVPFNPAMSAGEFYLHFYDKKISAVALERDLETSATEAAERLNLPILDILTDDPLSAGRIRLAGETGRAPVPPEPPDGEDQFVVFMTSGTTSYGKTVPLSHRSMLPRIRNMARMMGLRASDRVLNIMPLFHTGGFSAGMVTTLYSGGVFSAVKDNDVDALFRSLAAFQPTVIAGGYTVFHSIERKASAYPHEINAAKGRLRMLRTGTGHLDQKIARRLERIFETPVLEAYGSAETSFMACTGLPPEPRKEGSVGRPDRERVFIIDKNGDPLPPFDKGEIAVTKETAFDGYENNPDANRAAFSDKWYHTGDEGYFDEEGFLFITGRIKEMINRGGIKIIPTEVDQAMLRHVAVREAVAFPMPHPTLGEDLALAVVPEDQQTITEQALKTYLKAHLTPNKIPSRILIVQRIPKSATGKAQRRKLAESFNLLAPAGDTREGPATPAALPGNTALIRRIWQQTLGLNEIGLDDNFFALGGDSLQAVDLFMRLEKELGCRLPRDVLFQAGSVREMAELIGAGGRASCVVPIQPKGSRPPLFFVHPIGGEVLGYRKLARYLHPDQPFYGIQQYRQEDGKSRFSSLEEMAEYYLQEIQRTQPEGPYYLGGHSFGGLVAYRIACKLASQGEQTAFLALLDTYLPTPPRYVSPARWLAGHYEKWKALPKAEKRDYLLARGRNIARGGLRKLRLKLLSRRGGEARGPREDAKAPLRNQDINALNVGGFRAETYQGDAVLFRTELPVSFNPAVHDGWRDLICGKFEICDLPGGHVEMMDEPVVQTLGSLLSKRLDDAQRRYAAPTDVRRAGAGS